MGLVNERKYSVYQSRGERHVTARDESALRESAAASEHEPIRTLARRELVCIQPDLDLSEAVHLMVKHRIGCIPVVDEDRHPVGVITKTDVMERLDSELQDDGAPTLAERTAAEIMTPLALSLHEEDSILRASELMIAAHTHHVLVVSASGALVGVVSAKDIVNWLIGQHAPAGPPTDRITVPQWHA